jgi:hypothetical protein
VGGRVVVVENPAVVLPLFRMFAPNALQNFTIKLPVDSLTRGDKFLVDNALDVKKKRSKLVPVLYKDRSVCEKAYLITLSVVNII